MSNRSPPRPAPVLSAGVKEEPYGDDTDDDEKAAAPPLPVVSAQVVAVKDEVFDEDTDDETVEKDSSNVYALCKHEGYF